MNQFRKLVEDQKKQKSVRDFDPCNLYTDLSSSEIIETISKNRNAYAHVLTFNEEEINALISLEKIDQEEQIRYICYHFLFTVLDHKYIVEEKIGLDEALEGKFLILLGISNLKDLISNVQNTALYEMLFLLKSYNYYAYNTIYRSVSTIHINNVNDLLASFGSVLSFATNDKPINCTSKSMHFECFLPELRAPNKFSYYVSDYDANKPAFRKIYDFYFEKKVKPAFDAILEPKKGIEAKEFIDKSKENVIKAKTQHFEKLISKYSFALDMKLKNLLARNKKDEII